MLPFRAATAIAAVVLCGCGDVRSDEGRSAATGEVEPATVRSSPTTSSGASGAPAATAAQIAATPDGIVPTAPAAEAADPAVLLDLRRRLGRAPATVRRDGTARYRLDLLALGARVRGSGRADFRSRESLGTVRVGARALEYYSDGGARSYTRSAPGAPWDGTTSIVPNAPGNSTAIYAGQIRVGRAGRMQTVAGTRCRWAAGVVPLRALLSDAGALDEPEARNLLRFARPDAVFPTGVCVAENGRIPEVRFDVRFDRDVGLSGPEGRLRFRGRIAFSAFGREPAIDRPTGLPTT